MSKDTVKSVSCVQNLFQRNSSAHAVNINGSDWRVPSTLMTRLQVCSYSYLYAHQLCVCIPLKMKTAQEVIQAYMRHVYSKFSGSENILSDNGIDRYHVPKLWSLSIRNSLQQNPLLNNNVSICLP